MDAVISAIYFLYGRRPKVSIDNAVDILEEAEFLMIEELKAYTIRKIKSIEVEAENCFKLLFISSRYDVKLERLETFFKAHLQELLSKEEALHLDRDYIYSIFTDVTLSYVGRQDLFLFLIKWVAHCPARNEAFPELMNVLKLAYIRKESLDEIDMDSLNDENKTLCHILASKTCFLENVLIINCQAQYDYLNRTLYVHAFNVDKKYWFKIRSSHALVKGLIENKMVLVYIKDSNTLCRLNLGTNEESQKKFKWLDELDAQIPYASSSSEFTCIRHMSKSTEKLYVVREARLNTHISKQRTVSTIYCNDKTDEFIVDMKALIAVNGELVQFGVTDALVCLIVKGSKQLTVYAADVGIISTVDLSQLRIDYNTIFSAVEGGKLYITTNTKYVVQLNIYKEGLAIKTSVRESVLEGYKNESRGLKNNTHFEFTEDKIITVTEKYENDKSRLSYAYQKLPEDINCVHKEEKIALDVPEALKYDHDVHFLEAYLPSDAPRCHDKCPLCAIDTKDLSCFDDSDEYYDSDDNIYYNDDDSDDSDDKFVENHW